jgi:sugar phosphate isomerase/epimerase
MKICCSSRSYAPALQSGDLTQLEWVDRCAGLALDGVDLGSAHFPRTDSDYLAQIRKLCVDRGLTVAAVTLDGTIGDGDVDAQAALAGSWIARASELGAPLLRVTCGASSGSPGIAWRELIRALKTIAHEAKTKNVTLALEPRAGSLVSSSADCKRAQKECDSAWLRIALPLDFTMPSDADAGALLDETVFAVSHGVDVDTDALRSLRHSGYIGFVSIETVGGDHDVAAAVARLLS